MGHIFLEELKTIPMIWAVTYSNINVHQNKWHFTMSFFQWWFTRILTFYLRGNSISICIYILVLTLYHQYKISTFIHNFYHKKDKTTPKFSLDVLISILSTFCSKYITGSQEYQFFLCIKWSPAFPCISKNYPA